MKQQLLFTSSAQDTLLVSVNYRVAPSVIEAHYQELGTAKPREKVQFALQTREHPDFTFGRIGLLSEKETVDANVARKEGELEVSFAAPSVSGRKHMVLTVELLRSDGLTLAVQVPVGLTVTTVDCLIAQTAIAHDHLLLTADRDFERIGTVSALRLA